MRLPKSHTPHKVTKKTEFKKHVNKSTSQHVNKILILRIIELSRFRDFGISGFLGFLGKAMVLS